MAKKKDIGTLFENKLKEGTKVPSNGLWEKINTSLDREERKRKRFFFYWLVGGGIIALIGLAVLYSNSFFRPATVNITENNHNNLEEPQLNAKSENEKAFQILMGDSINLKENKEEKLSRILDLKKDSLFQSKNSSEKNSKSKSESAPSKKKGIDESFKVSEKYYYYNSENGKQIVTENKEIMDSLLRKATKSSDTTLIKKKDSLPQ